LDAYKRSVRRLLAKNSRPLHVEKIRKACHMGNWQTALKHCLELLYEGKIQGIKTSKSWLFWAKSSRAIPTRFASSQICKQPEVEKRKK
jgi:hypothetical protein